MFRCDASPRMGGGHTVRCLALADALKDAGWRATFAGGAETRATVPALAQSRHGWVELSGGAAQEPERLGASLSDGCDLLVVDHYGRDAQFETACRPFARHILAIDDVPGRDHDCDFLLDATPGRKREDYAARVPAGCRFLLGPSYALLRRQFAERRDGALSTRKVARQITRVIVSLGLTDPGGLTLVALRGIVESGLDCAIDVVIGAASPHLASVRELAASLDGRVKIHVDVPDMAALMAKADIAIGAGGSSSFERCALGLPSVVVIVADNQQEIAASLEQAGAAAVMGEAGALRPESVAAELRKLAGDESRRAAMSRAGALLCDGRGARRAAIALAPERAADGKDVTLRPVTLADGGIMLEWQRHPTTRRHFRNTAIPSEDEHRTWLKDKLADHGVLLNIVLYGEEPAGVVRLDRIARQKMPAYEISILIAPGKRGLGVGKAALALARRLVPEADFWADVIPENEPSQALFRSAGFIRKDQMFVNPAS